MRRAFGAVFFAALLAGCQLETGFGSALGEGQEAAVMLEDICGVPSGADPATPLTFTPEFLPENAVNADSIAWSVVADNDETGAVFTGYNPVTLEFPKSRETGFGGTVAIRAEIASGEKAARGDAPFTSKDFTIQVKQTFMPVEGIDLAGKTNMVAGASLTLSGAVRPENATN
jgi:hypothetical protein